MGNAFERGIELPTAGSRSGQLDPQPPGDSSLVERCRQGDGEAWKSLVLRFQRLVYAVPRNMGLDDDECDDVFLETFSRLVRGLDQLDRGDRVRPWLVTTARRLALDTIRRRRRHAPFAPDVVRLAAPEESALERLARLSERDTVHRALKRLARRCRALLALLYRGEPERPPSYQEVSRRLGIPVGSIGPTRARCLDALLVEYRKLEQNG